MIPTYHSMMVEHRLRVARAERLGPHLAEIDLQKRRRGRRLDARARVGGALIAAGMRLQAIPPSVPVPSAG